MNRLFDHGDAVAAPLDQAAVDAFTMRMGELLNSAAVALMISIGHRTSLFDVMATLPPSTSTEIAAAAKLNERYVREWLGAMTTGLIVLYDADHKTYRLPREHAAALTRAATPANIAVPMQFLPILGSVEDDIVRCFREGGGVPYEKYGRFHEVMAEESAQSVVYGLIDHALPLAPGIIARLEAGIDVLDIGCGRGKAMMHLAQRFPLSRFAGYDLCIDTVAWATHEAVRLNLTNVRFEQRDLTALGEIERYDLITAFDAIHDQARPGTVLANIRRALRPGGTFLMQDIRGSSCVHCDIENPIAPFAYTISCMHCMSVSLSQGGEGLGAMWGQQRARELLAAAGFSDVAVNQLPHDIQNDWYVARGG
ncbi:MAG: class I SAM-dependent methyltransferase [Phycisphaerae bacterium]